MSVNRTDAELRTVSNTNVQQATILSREAITRVVEMEGRCRDMNKRIESGVDDIDTRVGKILLQLEQNSSWMTNLDHKLDNLARARDPHVQEMIAVYDAPDSEVITVIPYFPSEYIFC